MPEEQYTPTDAEVLESYGWSGHDSHIESNRQAQEAQFSRWLAAHDAEVRADERAKRPDREQIVEKLAEALGEKEALFCTRDWSGWTYNTMTAEDFMDVSGDAEALGEVADAVLGPFMGDPEAREVTDAEPLIVQYGLQYPDGYVYTGPAARWTDLDEARKQQEADQVLVRRTLTGWREVPRG